MTFEQALLAALGAVVPALCFVCKLLWGEAVACKADRSALRKRVELLEGEHGIAKGKVSIYERCHAPGCPFGPIEPRPKLP